MIEHWVRMPPKSSRKVVIIDIEKLDELRQQRDELFEACKAAVPHIYGYDPFFGKIRRQLWNAIYRVEGREKPWLPPVHQRER